MAGKRVAQSYQDVLGYDPKEMIPKKKMPAGWIVFGVAAALLVGGAAALGISANSYDRVFPGVTLGEESLAGYTRQELAASLASGGLLSGQVSVTANGENLGRYTQRELGAYIDTERLEDAAWSVGREEGALGWFKNGWTMLSGLLGGKVRLDVEILYDGGVLRAAAAEMAGAFDRDPVAGSYELTREGLYATTPVDGRTLDQEALVQAITALEGGSGSVEAAWEETPGQGLDMEALALELNTEPSNARYDIEQGRVVDGMVGVSLDPEAAQFAMDAAAPGETVKLPAQVIYPEMTAQELEAVLFRDELGSTSTKLSGTKARRNNVKLAGDCCDGVILNDGDIFDYNQVVGRRTVERGFGAAPAYVSGETVETIGGGICQVSSTIYYAALLSNLEIVERYAHGYTPSYIKWGMDATVSWGGPEFRFRNDTGYPIRLDVECDNNQIKVTIVGTKTDDTYVEMTYEEISSKGYETEYIETDELDWGVQKQKQSPYTGHTVISYRNIYRGDGTLISSTQEAKSVYKSRNEIILVGTRGKPASGTVLPEAGGDDPGLPEEPGLPTEDTGEPVLPSDGSPGMSIFG